jgi:hypothetical protein
MPVITSAKPKRLNDDEMRHDSRAIRHRFQEIDAAEEMTLTNPESGRPGSHGQSLR